MSCRCNVAQVCKPHCVGTAIAAHLPWGTLKTWAHQHWEGLQRLLGIPEARLHPEHHSAHHAAVDAHAQEPRVAAPSGLRGARQLQPWVLGALNKLLRRVGLRPVRLVPKAVDPKSVALAAIADS